MFDVGTVFMLIHDEDAKLCELDSRRFVNYLSGFSGSSGVAIFGEGVKIFASDHRYELQMQKELLTGWEWFLDNKSLPTKVFEKLKNQNIKKVFVVGEFCSCSAFLRIKNALKDFLIDVEILPFETVIRAVGLDVNIFSEVKKSRCFRLPKTATMDAKEKASMLKNLFANFFNGNEIFYIGNKNFVGWITGDRKEDGFNRNPDYDIVLDISDNMKIAKLRGVKSIKKKMLQIKCREVVFDPENTNALIVDLIKKTCKKTKEVDLADVYLFANKKDNIESKQMMLAHIADGLALSDFLFWLDENYSVGNITEKSAADRLLQFRKMNKKFLGLSFPTISAFGENAAIVHYSKPSENVKIFCDGIYLVDSGGQYKFGTTDVTRSVCIGSCSSEQKKMFTAVLKAHIAVATAVFTSQTYPMFLDALSRSKMKPYDIDYQHGTGHGIGYLGNVHEGPVSISKYSKTPLDIGMFVSNEPGFYKHGEYGIRIENVARVVPLESDSCDFWLTGQTMKDAEKSLEAIASIGGLNFDREILWAKKNVLLGFETVSFAPIDLRLIDISILTNFEKKWINEYHKNVYKKISPKAHPNLRRWLKNATFAI